MAHFYLHNTTLLLFLLLFLVITPHVISLIASKKINTFTTLPTLYLVIQTNLTIM